jgi:hypothetical protein
VRVGETVREIMTRGCVRGAFRRCSRLQFADAFGEASKVGSKRPRRSDFPPSAATRAELVDADRLRGHFCRCHVGDRDGRRGQRVDVIVAKGVVGDEDGVLDAVRRNRATAADHGGDRIVVVQAGADRLLDRRDRPTNVAAVAGEDRQLLPDRLAAVGDVEPAGVNTAAPADPDRSERETLRLVAEYADACNRGREAARLDVISSDIVILLSR